MDAFQNDHELVAALNVGNRLAFEIIYKTHIAELYRYARRNIQVREDCEEIIQDVFESLWARRADLNIRVIRHYLLDMVKYKMIRYFQKNTTRKKYAEHFRLFEAVYEFQQEENIILDQDQLRTLIDDSMAKLPERCQAAFRMRLGENLTNAEIALRMNIKKDTVENYMVRAIHQIRDSYHTIYNAG